MNPRHKHFLFWVLTAIIGLSAIMFLLIKVNEYKRGEDISLMESALNKVKSALGSKYSAGWEIYKGSNFIFNYPAKLSLFENNGEVVLEHKISYKNSGDCDMKGGEETFDDLTDFRVAFEMFNGSVRQAVLKNSPYMPKENYSGDILKISPGFIDSYQIGNFSGFAILEGAEGCGRIIYYFPIDNQRVLIVDRANIQALSSIIVKEKRDEVLAVPGVITPEENEKIFRQILESLKIFNTKLLSNSIESDTSLLGFNDFVNVKPGWKYFTGHTAYGDSTNFSIQYPGTWELVDYRGGNGLKKGDCEMALGGGGFGLEGESPKIIMEKNINSQNSSGRIKVESVFGKWLSSIAFDDIYLFYMWAPVGNQNCVDDFIDIVRTVKLVK